MLWRFSYALIEDIGVFAACPSWVALNRPTYGVHGLDEFKFDINKTPQSGSGYTKGTQASSRKTSFGAKYDTEITGIEGS